MRFTNDDRHSGSVESEDRRAAQANEVGSGKIRSAVVLFYRELLHLPVVDEWDRPSGRGTRSALGGGLRVEILYSAREKQPAAPVVSGDRTYVVVEAPDIDVTRQGLAVITPEPKIASWSALLFQVRDSRPQFP